MQINKKMIIVSYITTLLFFISFFLYYNDMIKGFIVSIFVTIISFLYYCYMVYPKKNNKSPYERRVNKILKKYNDILVHLNNSFEITNEDILYVKKFEDLVVAHKNFNKPILYFYEKNLIIFLVHNENDLLIYRMC